MLKYPSVVLAACVLAACSGNPFDKTEPQPAPPPAAPAPDPNPTPAPEPEPEPEPEPIGIEGRELPPGTRNPTATTDIVRFERLDTENGNGFANNFRYEPATSDGGGDLFYVEGLAFDGDQPDGTAYTRSRYQEPSLNAGEPIALGTGFAAYEGPSTVPDFLTGEQIPQLQHRALFKRSSTMNDGDPLTSLAIVRTGSYAGYGFGGFVYQRNGDVVLPTSGLATYSGDYAGLRDFNGVAGLQYTTGSMDVAVDFNGFSGNCTPTRCTDAVRGSVHSRQIFDMNGNEVTQLVIDAINAEKNARITGLPVLEFRIGAGVLDRNGEITGTLSSEFFNNNNQAVVYEAGNYYAIMAGDHTSLNGGGGEIVGIIVVEGDNSNAPGSTFRETGGFIVTREQAGP